MRDVLLSQRPSDTLMEWALNGYLKQVLPDLHALRGVSQLPAHRDDAFIHTLKVVDAIEATPVRRWAALLHDIGKGPTYIETPEGRSRFFEHDKVGVLMAGEIVAAAGESRELTEQVQRLVGLHMRPISYNSEWTDAAVRRLRDEAEAGRGPEGWLDLLALSRADLKGYLPEPIDRGLWVLQSLEEHARRIEAEDAHTAREDAGGPRSPLDGSELLAIGRREPGPWVGALKEHLRAEVEAGRLDRHDKPSAEAVAKTWLSQNPEE